MSAIQSKTLFFFTSPRSPLKMIPEIDLLIRDFEGEKWSPETQKDFMEDLTEQDFYIGSKNLARPAFSARDRINRAPKALGFVDLKPKIERTPAGEALLSQRQKEEPLLRQLLKFQLPSPFHTISKDNTTVFWVKPYLEIIRLIDRLGTLAFDELQIFGMQLTDYRSFDDIVQKIEAFREGKKKNQGRYKEFFAEVCEREIRSIYHETFEARKFRTRESSENSEKKFISTKKSNMRDYADACSRYLRATGLFSISRSGKSLSVMAEHRNDVEFILKTVNRDPVFVDEEKAYKAHLFDAETPKLYSDDIDHLLTEIHALDADVVLEGKTLSELKDIHYDLVEERKEDKLAAIRSDLETYQHYDDIIELFGEITQRGVIHDAPLMFEWNTWRAMTMLDHGDIQANLRFDDQGDPTSTAPGKRPDVVCDYGDFVLNVEVTLQSGMKQYENEGESVARHVGRMIAELDKPTSCLFLAPKINDAVKAHFYVLQQIKVAYYGGEANIIPLDLDTFKTMLGCAKADRNRVSAEAVRRFIDESSWLALDAQDENEWFDSVTALASDWLNDAAYQTT